MLASILTLPNNTVQGLQGLRTGVSKRAATRRCESRNGSSVPAASAGAPCRECLRQQGAPGGSRW